MYVKSLTSKIYSVTTSPTIEGCDAEGIHAFGVTLEAMARLNRLFDHSLREHAGISQTWFEALLRIERSGGHMTMGELGEQVALTSGGVTRLVDRLTGDGLTERRSCPEDRRIQYVAITERGRATLSKALEIHLDDVEAEFLGRMTPAESKTLVEVMDRLRSPSISAP